MKHSIASVIFSLAILLCGASAGVAQGGFPGKPVHIIVGYSPGGFTDTSARLLADNLSTQLGVPVVVENRPGASGHIGTEAVAKSDPDGYTLMFNTNDVVTGPAMGKEIGYNVFEDLVPVSQFAFAPFLLFINPDVPAKNAQEFFDYVRAHPGELHYASAGIGAPNHLGTQLLMNEIGGDAVHVPYQGGAPGLKDVVGGRVEFMLQTPPPILPMAEEGRVRILAVAASERLQNIPDVPTLQESGVGGFENGVWLGLLAPSGSPEDVVATLSEAVRKAAENPDIKERMANLGAITVGSTNKEYGDFLKSEYERWLKVVKENNLSLKK